MKNLWHAHNITLCLKFCFLLNCSFFGLEIVLTVHSLILCVFFNCPGQRSMIYTIGYSRVSLNFKLQLQGSSHWPLFMRSDESSASQCLLLAFIVDTETLNLAVFSSKFKIRLTVIRFCQPLRVFFLNECFLSVSRRIFLPVSSFVEKFHLTHIKVVSLVCLTFEWARFRFIIGSPSCYLSRQMSLTSTTISEPPSYWTTLISSSKYDHS